MIKNVTKTGKELKDITVNNRIIDEIVNQIEEVEDVRKVRGERVARTQRKATGKKEQIKTGA